MYKLTLTNRHGDSLSFNELNGAYQIIDIDGLNPPSATINTSEAALMDGARFNSSKMQMRQLQIAFAINKDAESNRVAVFKVVKSKQWIRCDYSNGLREVYIEGYVSACAVDYFKEKQVCTVTILCPSPYWRAAQSIANEMSSVTGGFRFPFASTVEPELVMGWIDAMVNVEIDNGGDVETGMTFEIYAQSPATNVKIIDYLKGDYIGLDFEFEAGDLVTLCTVAGNKGATLLRDGVTTNIFNSVMRGSKWLQLDFSGGVYTYETTSGGATALDIRILHDVLYEGV